MSATDVLLKPEEYVMPLVDFQDGLGFGVESMPRQIVVNNAVLWVALAGFQGSRFFWSSSATGPLIKRTKPRVPLL